MTTADRDVLTRCVQLATLAPSLHNSQPWRFRITGRTMELHADRSRRLDALDGSGRELLISVGAALFTLRVALRSEGWTTNPALFPEPGRPELIARLELQRTTTPSASVTALAGAIALRHTNRWPFTPDVVSADAMEELTAAATAQGATLTVAGAVSRNAILGLGRSVGTDGHPHRPRPARRGDSTQTDLRDSGRRGSLMVSPSWRRPRRVPGRTCPSTATRH